MVTLSPEQLEEWLLGLGVLPPLAEGDAATLHERLKDGIALCQLINRVKSGGVDEVRVVTGSGGAELDLVCVLFNRSSQGGIVQMLKRTFSGSCKHVPL